MDLLTSLSIQTGVENQLLAITVLIFISTVIISYLLFSWLTTGDEDIKRRLHEIKSGLGYDSHESHTEGVFRVRWIEPIAQIALPKADWEKSRIRKKLVRAGYRNESALRTYYAIKVILAVALPMVLVLPLIISGTIPLVEQVFAVSLLVMAALVGYYIPSIFIYIKGKQRKTAFTEGFPDAMDMLVVCVEAGLGLDAAIQRVGKELAISHPELSVELNILSLELRAGKGRSEALRSLAERIEVEQVKSLVALLVQAEHFGTSVAAALREHAEEMRNIRIQVAKEKAAKLPVKMLFPIIFFIFPSLFIVVLAPAALRIYVGLLGGTLN